MRIVVSSLHFEGARGLRVSQSFWRRLPLMLAHVEAGRPLLQALDRSQKRGFCIEDPVERLLYIGTPL